MIQFAANRRNLEKYISESVLTNGRAKKALYNSLQIEEIWKNIFQKVTSGRAKKALYNLLQIEGIWKKVFQKLKSGILNGRAKRV